MTVTKAGSPNANLKFKDVDGSREIFINGHKTSILAALQYIFVQNSEQMEGIASDQAESAQSKLDDIKEARHWVDQAKECKLKAKENKGDSGSNGNCQSMSTDMQKYFKKHKIKWDETGKDTVHNSDEWQVNIDNLQTYENDLSDTQDLKMLKVKSAANKYSESVQAANKFLQDLTQLQHSLISR